MTFPSSESPAMYGFNWEPFTLNELVVSVPISMAPYGYTFKNFKGPEHLVQNLLGKGFERELNRRTR